MNPTIQASILALAEAHVFNTAPSRSSPESDDRVREAFKVCAQAMLDILSKQGEGHGPRRWIDKQSGNAVPRRFFSAEEYRPVSELLAERARFESERADAVHHRELYTHLQREWKAERARSAKLVAALELVMGQPFKGDWDSQAVFISEVLCRDRRALKEAGGSDE